METLILVALKSILIAGAVLLLLKLMHKRSAADRSWIAHLGLAAILMLPVAAIALPSLDVEGPSILVGEPTTVIRSAVPTVQSMQGGKEGASGAATFPAGRQAVADEPVDWAFWVYAVPAAFLVLITLIALFRLFLLKARATVLIEPHWLTALARAQRRMNFKHGTALLTSDDLPSPISWGVIRPVILLNSEAANSHDEAEAIITHELAHVARLDWAKLLLARVTTALFWFNPLVWVLAREAHQLREEAADDAVLGSNIEDTDYARLLVGVARHECRGLLIGAHGVAPAKNSLTRRIKRVLDSASARAPGGWRWSSAAAFFAAGMAVPVAALNFVPAGQTSAAAADAAPQAPYYVASGVPAAAGAGAGLAAAPAATAGAAAMAAAHPHREATDEAFDIDVDAADVADLEDLGEKIDGAVAGAVAGAVSATASAEASQAVAARVHGLTPAYAAAMRSAAPQLAEADMGKLIAMKVQGITPDYVRDITRAGMRWSSAGQLIGAKVQGVDGAYLRSLAAVGYPSLSYSDAIQMRMHRVSPQLIQRLRRQGYGKLSPGELVAIRLLGDNDEGEGDP